MCFYRYSTMLRHFAEYAVRLDYSRPDVIARFANAMLDVDFTV